jgi:hypothetical protein
MIFNLPTDRIIKQFIALNIFFIVTHLFFAYIQINFDLSYFESDLLSRFNMDREVSIPTWFAQILLLILSVSFFWIAKFKLASKDQFRFHWFFLGCLSFFMSIDEGAELHELATHPIQQLLSINSGLLFFAWIIPVLITLVILLLLLTRFITYLDQQTRNLLILAAIIFVSGAVGIEMISGAYWQANNFEYNMIYRILNSAEEGLENFGTILAIFATLDYIRRSKFKTVSINLN